MMAWFADSSGLAAFADKSQTHHVESGRLVRGVCDRGDHFITTDYVLVELTALLTSPLRIPKPTQIAFLETLRSVDWVRVLPIDPTTLAAAWKLWGERPDKTWSLVDCSSFVVMNQLGVTDSLTSDRHFEQAGFVRLLR